MMAMNDCWWWLDAMLQEPPEPARPPTPPARRRTHDMAIGAAGVVLLIIAGALLWNLYKAQGRWAKERAVSRKNCDDTKALVNAVADRRVSTQAPIQDSWGVDLRIKDNPNGIIGHIEVTSAGPDLTFDTRDDISEVRSSSLHLDRAGEKFGKGLGDFGAGAVRGLYRSAKEHLAGQKEDAHANPDASPNEGTNP